MTTETWGEVLEGHCGSHFPASPPPSQEWGIGDEGRGLPSVGEQTAYVRQKNTSLFTAGAMEALGNDSMEHFHTPLSIATDKYNFKILNPVPFTHVAAPACSVDL